MFSVCAVVLTKNSSRTIKKCLESILKCDMIKEIVVVDGGSTDDTLDIVSQFPVKMLFDKGRGISYARNLGWHNCSCELILFLDSDAFLNSFSFLKALEPFLDSDVGGVGCVPVPVVYNIVSKTIGEIWEYKYKSITRSPLIGGACFIFRKKALEDVGGFHTAHIYGSDDLCLSYRILRRGYKLVWLRDVKFFHFPRGSIKEYFKEQFGWGVGSSIFVRELGSKERKLFGRRSYYKFIFPLVSIYLALKYRNPFHFIVFNIGQLGWFMGFLVGWLKIRR